VTVRDVQIGGGAPIVIQSMTSTYTHDVAATVDQVKRLEDVGCELIRVAVPDEDAANALPEIKRQVSVPLIADIHFSHKLALLAIEKGADKIRLNPGNIMLPERVKEVAARIVKERVPVRVGVNSGSITPRLNALYAENPAEGIVESALEYVRVLEDLGVTDIVVSLKSSDVPTTVEAYRRFAAVSDRPLHVGVTEAGPDVIGAARTAVALGMILSEGVGDTIRVSLTGDPVDEVVVAREILQSLKLRADGVTIVSCPTCGRVEFDVAALVADVRGILFRTRSPLKVAIMGCSVNGPGESREADIGVSSTNGAFLIFKNGKIVRSGLSSDNLREALWEELAALAPDIRPELH
jgi:(E)-4-hydroxy-3-methylbut-2-enyl-diphosphate synthase